MASIEESERLNDYFIPANLIPMKAAEMDMDMVMDAPINVDVSKFMSQKAVEPLESKKGFV
jgi:hypothetical protein